ncbi:uncharacterized protein C8A04DRAFT_11746 [Dichotomopilus funicola]|uniref:MICOS complex subunit MIC12 n=1 Tax=Dichotomopilus funicola TaxID=1934379 RepID=A0AAN6V3J7_9PEZI|nr:hypothetical protein C8A04DRAFT_11746 [Dichotomopilus funicola]
MGFAAGFAGGTTLTLSLTYLALLTHASHRRAQSALLRSQAATLDSLVPDDPASYLPTAHSRRRNASLVSPDGGYRARGSLQTSSPGGRERDSTLPVAGGFVEEAKARWNGEVLSAVQWLQGRDWVRVREDVEDKVADVLGVGRLSREPVDVPQQGQGRQQQHQQEGHGVGYTAGERLHHARDTTVAIAQAMEHEAREVVVEAKEVVAAGVEGAKGAVERGVWKAHDLVERTKAATHLAEERAITKADAKLWQVSGVEQALAERYDSALREKRLQRSVEEVLRERYRPIDERDNSHLRGV